MSQASTHNRYAAMFARLEKEQQKAFIPFTLLGWPNRDASFKMIQSMIDAGASALELGLAFSDPMADGVIIQEAAKETLATGFKVDDAMALLKDIRAYNAEIPIGLLVYYNMVLARGIDRFFQELAEVGVDGVLIADLPPENLQEVAPAAQKNNIQLICIASPLTDNTRLQTINTFAGGFIYVVSRLGITGVEENFDQSLRQLMARLKQNTKLPLCVGFGISKPEHATQMINAGADGVIIGSRIIQLIKEQKNPTEFSSLKQYVQDMLQTCEAGQASSTPVLSP